MVVTNWKPRLEIWFCSENYLRFTSDNYDPNNLHNKFANLTNATVNKENIKDDTYDPDTPQKNQFNEEETSDYKKTSLIIEENMYTNF